MGFEKGEIVSCDECRRARPLETRVLELFGAEVAFGPAGESDMFVKRDEEVTCKRFLDDCFDVDPDLI